MSGKTSMVETAALAFVYAIVVECFVTRDLHVFRNLPRALVKSSVLAGSVLILLSAAMGITSYIVDAQIPDLLLTTVRAHTDSLFFRMSSKRAASVGARHRSRTTSSGIAISAPNFWAWL